MQAYLKSVLLVLCALVLAPVMLAQDDPELPALPILDNERIHPEWLAFQPEFTPYVCPFHASAPKYDTEEFRCGYVLVPEDRTKADSRLIQLSVLQIKSSSENPDQRAVVRLTGGPGGPSLSDGRIRAYQSATNRRFRDAADLIFFDQRGIGYSEAHFCRAVPRSFQFGKTTEENLSPWISAFTECLEEARAKGIAVDAYSTWQNAYDVRDIRRALGYDQWTLFGVSYGTQLGQAVIDADPEGVRAAILDSIVPAAPLASGGWNAVAYGFRSALTSINADCQADTACARDIGDMTERFIETFIGYEEEPMILEGLDRGSYLDGRLVLDGTVAAGAVFQALYVESLYADFPSLLKALENRDEIAMRAYTEVLGRTIDHSYGNGMELIANCRGSALLTEEQVAAQRDAEPVLSRFVGTLVWHEICPVAYHTDADPAVRALETDIPVLVGAGLTDPITPPNYGQAIMPGLSNGQYVEFPHTGHGVFVSHFDGCGGDLWLAFLNDPDAPLDTSCVADITAPVFLTRLIETKAPYTFARGLQSGQYPYAVFFLAGLLLISVIMFPLGWLARKVQGVNAPSLSFSRSITWGGALITLFGLGWAISQILATATQHPMALPIGVLTSTGLAFWIALIGFGLTAFALYRGITSGGFGKQQLGASIGLIVTCLASLGILIFIVSLGLGPF